MQRILQLEAMGFEFTFEGEKLTYSYTGKAPPPENAAMLLAHVKLNRQEAVCFLRGRAHDQRVQSLHSRIWEQYAENISASEALRAQINKAVNAGAKPEEVLPLALECISLMTGDTVFYRQNMAGLSSNGMVS